MRLRAMAGVLAALAGAAADAGAQVRVHPTGVNVNAQGATTVFLTFGGLAGYAPAEATWCGQLQPATPDIGERCDPSTIFGLLPAMFDQSRLSGAGGFTDIMSIPPSVARRAYQAAAAGEHSAFFYVRRFVGPPGSPDQYVAVTCRMAGGGARVPLSLTDVTVAFDTEAPVLFLAAGDAPPPLSARISYNGTGRLVGRWEVVRPGEDLPEPRDLLTEATLPVEERGTQRRYLEIERFNLFLPPTGRATIPGPAPHRLPADADGMYIVLLRVEASDDKEGDSSLAAVGAGSGTVHSGGVAGFPMPTIRYYVSGKVGPGPVAGLQPLLPVDEAALLPGAAVDFAWTPVDRAAFYRLEVLGREDGESVLAAVVPASLTSYRSPPWLGDQATGSLRWRVTALDAAGGSIARSEWRTLRASDAM
jgi:hypothetical protein